MQTTLKLGLKKLELTDSPPDITVLNYNWDILDEALLNGAADISFEAGLFAARPVFGTLNRYYLATDRGEIWRDTGAAWTLAAASRTDFDTHVTDETAHGVGIKANLLTTEKTNIVGAINELFTSASNGKNGIAAAITGMGQAASGADSFALLASKISDISDDANAGVGDVLPTKTFYQGGLKRTGTMATKGVATITPGTVNQVISANQYLTGDQTILGDSDLVPANIKKDVNIFNVVGTLNPTGIKSIQRVAYTIDAATEDAVIASVDPTKSIVLHLGEEGNGGSLSVDIALTKISLRILDATHVRVTRGNSGGTNRVSFCVIEFESAIIKSKQSGYTTLSTTAQTTNVTVSAVDLAKSILVTAGWDTASSFSGTSDFLDAWCFTCELTTATNIKFWRYADTGSIHVAWELIEFY